MPELLQRMRREFDFVLIDTAPLLHVSDGRLIAKLADDFCAFPAAVSTHPRVVRFFRRVSLLWALVFLTNGVTTLFMLARRTVGDFLLVSSAGSWTVVGIGAIISLWWFRRSLRGEGIVLRLGGPRPALPAA